MSLLLTLILTSLQASIIVSSSLSSLILLEMLETWIPLRRLCCSSFDIWISRVLAFFSRLPHTVFCIAKSLFSLSFLDESWFTVSVDSFIWVQRLFISSPSIGLSIGKKMWIREVQKDLKNIPNLKNLSTQWVLFEDEDGIWCCGGRLAKSNLPYSVIHPCFIPEEHYFTKLVVLKSHTNVKHNGVRDTINNLREEFWISKGRNFLKAIINNCSVCRKFEGPSYDYLIQRLDLYLTYKLILIFHILLLV